MSIKYPKEFRNREELIKWYIDHRWFHGRLSQIVAHYLEWRVESYFDGINLPVLAKISQREKTLASVMLNVTRGIYGPFPIARERLNDLAGVRAVFYFRDDVQNFCDQRSKLFRSWFGIYVDESTQYNNGLESKAWEGTSKDYLSHQFTVRVDADTEFFRALNDMDQRFMRGLFCEVQLRTTLQDAWAEANHDIRYKLEQDQGTRREHLTIDSFHRLADHLRTADDTLIQLKSDYVLNVEQRTQFNVKPTPTEVRWTSSAPEFSKAENIDGVEYAYELLDSDLGEEAKEPVRIVSSTTVFNVDESMWRVAGVTGYKVKMWELLQRTEAQFVTSISYDSMVVRVTSWNFAERTLGVELAAYSDQVVTNHKRAQDKEVVDDPQHRKVRRLAVDGTGELLPFEKSPLSNTVGVCCVIKTSDDVWCIGLRSPSVAFDPGTWGCPASGALNWVELGHWENRTFEGWFQNGIVREIEEELGYTARTDEVRYLGLAREFGRLGKPQVFFLVDADIRCEHLISKFRAYKHSDSEYQSLEFLREDKIRDLIGADEEKVNRLCRGAKVNEELRFNLALALQYVDRRA